MGLYDGRVMHRPHVVKEGLVCIKGLGGGLETDLQGNIDPGKGDLKSEFGNSLLSGSETI